MADFFPTLLLTIPFMGYAAENSVNKITHTQRGFYGLEKINIIYDVEKQEKPFTYIIKGMDTTFWEEIDYGTITHPNTIIDVAEFPAHKTHLKLIIKRGFTIIGSNIFSKENLAHLFSNSNDKTIYTAHLSTLITQKKFSLFKCGIQ